MIGGVPCRQIFDGLMDASRGIIILYCHREASMSEIYVISKGQGDGKTFFGTMAIGEIALPGMSLL